MNSIAKDVKQIRDYLLFKEPEHFSAKRIVAAFFGALFLGLTFTLKGLLFEVSQAMSKQEVTLIIIGTIAILTAEIYFVGYKRVRRKKQRKFGQFWIKRMLAYYAIAIFVATVLVHMYGLQNFAVSQEHMINMIIAVSLPCATGAAAADLLEKY